MRRYVPYPSSIFIVASLIFTLISACRTRPEQDDPFIPVDAAPRRLFDLAHDATDATDAALPIICAPNMRPVRIAQAPYGVVSGIAADAATLYFSNYTQGVYSVPKSGGEPQQIDSAGRGRGIVADDRAVYWTSRNGVMVLRRGSSPVLLAADGEPAFLALDETDVYWTNASGWAIRKVPKKGGMSSTIAMLLKSPWRIAVDAENVFFSYESSNPIVRVSKQGGTPVELVLADSYVKGVALDASSVYFTQVLGRLIRIPKDTVTQDRGTVITNSLSDPWDVVSSNGYFYVANRGYNVFGSIVRVHAIGGVIDDLATNQASPVSLVLDETCVYWVTEVGEVMKASR